MTLSKRERRIARLSRQCARIVLELRAEGEIEGAARFERLAMEIVYEIRRNA